MPITAPNARPDLSIVVVNWNTQQMLRECLQSVADNLGGITAQVIVVDNASTDGSAEMVAHAFPDCDLIRNDENRGFAAANNQAFEVATGRHILLLNSDTIVLGDVLAASVRYLDARPEVGAMGCRVLNADRTMQVTCSQFPTPVNLFLLTSGLWKLNWPRFLGRYQMNDWARDSERDVEVISGCYLMVRREVLDQIGPLDEDFFFFGEETDWCRRMTDAGWVLRFAPVGEIVHYGGGSAKRLNYRRDVMLLESLVRLNFKHGGSLNGGISWGLVFLFNASRLIYWFLVRLISDRQHESYSKVDHFYNLFISTMDMWPNNDVNKRK